jgi:4'-phosphopantetheinyl transferase EntD
MTADQQTNLFPADLQQAAANLLRRPFAAVLLRQPAAATLPDNVSAALLPETTLLHAGEISRYHGYQMAKRRGEFLAGRLCAKMALIAYGAGTGQILPAPAVLEIANDENGKPFIRITPETREVPQISITHGGAYAAALAAQGPCGIDLQPHKENLLRVREKYCSAAEERRLCRFFPEMAQVARLALLWTAKEAAKKALACRHMPGFLQLELLSAKKIDGGNILTLAVAVKADAPWPTTVDIAATTFHDHGLAVCLFKKEEFYA